MITLLITLFICATVFAVAYLAYKVALAKTTSSLTKMEENLRSLILHSCEQVDARIHDDISTKLSQFSSDFNELKNSIADHKTQLMLHDSDLTRVKLTLSMKK